MKYDRNLVATIIENEFWDDLYNEIDDSVMNMEGQELDEAFETYVDYAELEADVSLDGYVYFEGENNMVNSSEVTLEFEFQFEHQNGKNRQFVSRVIA